MSRPVLWTLLVILLAALLFAWMLLMLEPAMVYHPAPAAGITPARAGLPYEDVRLRTEDGRTLRAWWVPRPEPDAPALLFFHGNAGNREGRLHNVAGLWNAGISVLIFDYRGYGGSSGRPSERGLMRDGRAAAAWLAERVPPGRRFYFGRSLGAAVAAHTALEVPPAALILESAFTSAPAMARRVLPLPGIGTLMRSRFNTLAAVRRLRVPLLVIHGTADELVPYAMGRAVYEEAASTDKAFRAVPGGRHNDTYVQAGPAYYDWLREFMGRSAAEAAGARD